MKQLHFKYYLLFSVCTLLLLTGCGADITPSGTTNQAIDIYPDYKDVTIPPNIAPLNFQVKVEEATALILSDTQGNTFQVRGNANGLFIIPPKKWENMLQANRGADITFTICLKSRDGWTASQPFTMHVAEEDIDPYLAYRLIQPTYTFWNEMGIFQRNLETYEQTPIYENKYTEYNCVNCHSFASRQPQNLLFHMRAKNAGTVLVQGSSAEKLNTKTDQTISALVYPYWHPSGNYITFSVNDTKQSFFAHSSNILEVFDNASDVVIYDVQKHEVFSSPLLQSAEAYETFPTFSPDGKSLYFCTATPVDSLPYTYKDVHYSLCRIEVDVETRTFGTKVDTLFNAEVEGKSISFPRISPDGRWLAVTLHNAGNFSIWHPEADLYLIDLQDGSMHPLKEANSPTATDSYHSWSTNSRWLAFSSRRDDGLYTRPYFTYVDAEGNAKKPFMLPQENPVKYYNDLAYSFNIPELVSGKVELQQQEIASIMKETPGIDVTFAAP